jgi:uncharacterized membrane protein YccC
VGDAGRAPGGLIIAASSMSPAGFSPPLSDARDVGRRQKLAMDTALALLFGVRLWLSVCLALYVAFWLELDNPYWAGTTAAIVCQPQVGASLRKGWYRMIGTLVGGVAIVVMTACFPQQRPLFLGVLALWGAGCAFTATVLHNFAAYAAALAGYTAAIIASDQLGATGGLNGQAFTLAVTRASEISIGIVSAGIVLAGTDLGGAPRRLATQFANLCAAIMSRFTGDLANAGPDLPDNTAARREFIRQVIALDPVIDQSLGESSRLRYHSLVLQGAVDGLFAALSGWRAIANHLVRMPANEARQEVAVVRQSLSPEVCAALQSADPEPWLTDPLALYHMCEAALERLLALPAQTTSLRLLADQAAKMLAGILAALNGLALLVAAPARAPERRGFARLYVPDWLPAFVNAGRAFVTIGIVALFWIVTAWPNGAGAMTFAAITVILLAPRADQAYTATLSFAAGTLIAAGFAAIVGFALLPSVTETFAAFSLAIGLYLVPAGALMAQPWLTLTFTAMTANFVPLLQPANPMSFDTIAFYNQAVAIVVGCGVGALSFRVLPPLSPAFRTRRLLTLTLRDLRGVAAGREQTDWEGHVAERLAVMPDEATPEQRAQLMAALSVGSEIMQLRRFSRGLDIDAGLDAALTSLAKGESALATMQLIRLDAALATRDETEPTTQSILHARGCILALSEVLPRYASYFDAGAVA